MKFGMKIISVFLVVFPCAALAGNFATCIIDGASEVQNDMAARAVFKVCSTKYPGGFGGVAIGSGRGWLSFDSGAECAAKHAAKTPSQLAGSFIYTACRKLYDKLQLDGAQ